MTKFLQNGHDSNMVRTPWSMLLILLLVSLAFVQSFPLSDENYPPQNGNSNDHVRDMPGPDAFNGGDDIERRDRTSPSDSRESQLYNKLPADNKILSDNSFGIQASKNNRVEFEKSTDNIVSDARVVISDKISYNKDNSSDILKTEPLKRHKRETENVFKNSHLEPCAAADKHYCIHGTCVMFKGLGSKACR